jgi:hypothetical protein
MSRTSYTTISGEVVDAGRDGETNGEWLDRIGKRFSDFTVEDVAQILATPLDYHCIDCGLGPFAWGCHTL